MGALKDLPLRYWIIGAVLLFAGYEYLGDRETRQPTGVLVDQDPIQENFSKPQLKIETKVASIEPLATYDIKARVLSKQRYWFGQFSKLAPYDFALGWRVMSDSNMIRQLHIFQTDRFYFYQWNERLPVQVKDIVVNSANVHLLPSNDKIKNQMAEVHVGDIIHYKGYLVRIQFRDGAVIRSSMVRDDTGPGACEVMWVTEIL